MLDERSATSPVSTPSRPEFRLVESQFSLRSLLLFTALAALVALAARHSSFLFAALGVPTMVYAIVSYLLRRNLVEGGSFRVWSSISASIVSSAMGVFGYWVYATDGLSPPLAQYVVALGVALVAGFWFGLIPVAFELVFLGFSVMRWRQAPENSSEKP